MRFLVICRAIEPAPIGYPGQMELLEATQERLANGTDLRIRDVLAFAGERAFALVIEAEAGNDLDHSVFGLPAEPLLSFEVHVLREEPASSAVDRVCS